MKQTDPVVMKDRAKNRIKYLFGRLYLRTMVCVAATVIGIGCTATVVGALFAWDNAAPHPMRSLTFPWRFSVSVMALPTVVALLGFAAFGAYRKKHKALLYVPPVREQILGLPANEVLVRGSEHPGGSQEELLRAASAVQASQPAELLRAAQGQNSV